MKNKITKEESDEHFKFWNEKENIIITKSNNWLNRKTLGFVIFHIVGYHILVPLISSYSWSSVLQFCAGISIVQLIKIILKNF